MRRLSGFLLFVASKKRALFPELVHVVGYMVRDLFFFFFYKGLSHKAARKQN